MKITDCTRQQAGECADALRELLRGEDANHLVDEDGESILSDRDRQYLRDLLAALEDAERRTPTPAAGG